MPLTVKETDAELSKISTAIKMMDLHMENEDQVAMKDVEELDKRLKAVEADAKRHSPQLASRQKGLTADLAKLKSDVQDYLDNAPAAVQADAGKRKLSVNIPSKTMFGDKSSSGNPLSGGSARSADSTQSNSPKSGGRR